MNKPTVWVELHDLDSISLGHAVAHFRTVYDGPTVEVDVARERRLNLEQSGVILAAVQCVLAVAAIWIGSKQVAHRSRKRRQEEVEAAVVAQLLQLGTLPADELSAILEQLNGSEIRLSLSGYVLEARLESERFVVIGRLSRTERPSASVEQLSRDAQNMDELPWI